MDSAAVGMVVQQFQQVRQVCQPALTLSAGQHALQRLLACQQLHTQGCHSALLQHGAPCGKALLRAHQGCVILRCQIRQVLAAKPAQRHPARGSLRCRTHQRLQ